MKKAILLLPILIASTMLILMPSSNAAPTIVVYGYTDKYQYLPGETVTVKIYIYNYGPDEIVLKNVTIYYPWYNIIWGGNEIIADINLPIARDGMWETTRTFTIPNDGRAYGDSIDVSYTYTIGSGTYTPGRPGEIPFHLISAPSYQSLKDMDKLLTIFTVETVLLIAGFVILAASLFLSARRPKIMWKTEEKQ